MGIPLLQTKFYIPPSRPEQVPRPRLVQRLDAGLGRKLTLVSAPAGFGKTTLVSEWVASRRRGGPRLGRRGGVAPPTGASTALPQVAWLSLDEGDNDPARFMTYLIAALQAAVQRTEGASIGEGVLAALQSPQPPPPRAVLTSLINELAARLYVTLNTIKVHTRNLYGKLGVHNRVQAVARARALGVLSSL